MCVSPSRRRSMELRREQEANRSVATIAKATVTGFQAYLNKVDGMVTSVVKKVAGEEEEDGEPKKLRSSRCGGRGICELFGTWDGQRPHGLGKAKFLMVLYHNPLPPLPPSPSTSLFSTVAFVWLSLSLSLYIYLSLVSVSLVSVSYTSSWSVASRAVYSLWCRIWGTSVMRIPSPATCTTNCCATLTSGRSWDT
jgi:hypothetical protein